jgi:transcriptional enhancer factor
VNHRSSTRPAIFWLLITSPHVPTHGNSAYTSERDLEEKPFVIHRFSELSSQSRRENLDVISNWRQKFPHLEPLYNSGELTCDIIHMDVSLELMGKHAPEGAELIACAEMSISGRDLEICEWQTVTSLIQPSELYRDPRYDVPLDGQRTNSHVLSVNDHEARIKVSFPAAIWTHSLTCLTDLQLRYNKAQMSQVGEISDTSTIPATEFVDQISMYQEVQSCSGHGLPLVRRAIILWTFHACTRSGNGGQTTWRHIDPAPSRRSCMSPSPHPSHLISAVMNENFNTWIDNPTTHIQNPNMLNQFVQGLATPPHTGGLRSPFASNGYGCHDQQFDMPPENLSFESATATIDSESTLVDSDTAANIDSFLSNSNVHIIIDYDNPAANWNVGQSESFDADPAWANYPAVPSSTPNIEWDGVKSHAWPDLSEPKHGGWVEEVEVEGKHAWADSSPAKPEHAYMDQIVDKLLPWIEQEDATTKDVYAEVDDVQLPELSAGIVDTKEQSWVDSGSGFDYSQLIERLKS